MSGGFFGLYEWLPLEELKRIQLVKVQKLVAYVWEHNPYYRKLFDDIGLRPGHIRSLSDYSRLVPITRKTDIMRDQDRTLCGTRVGIDEARVRQVCMTGGTSGRGQEIHALSQKDIETTTLAHAWTCYAAGVRPGDRVANTFPAGLSAAGQWLQRSLALLGAVPLNVGMYETEVKIKELVRFQPKAVMASTSYLLHLATRAAASGIDLPGLGIRALITAGEPYPVEAVERIENMWGARVHTWYGSTQRVTAGSCELGAVADGKLMMLHVPSQLMLFEVIDPDTGEQAGHGDEGEAVCTFFPSQASPILRYGSADRVRYRAAGSCPCGRPYDGIEGGSIARYDDMLKVRGVNVWPAAVDAVVFREAGVAEYQGRVFLDSGNREQAEVAVEFNPGVSGDDKRQVLARIAVGLRAQTELRFQMAEAVTSLPRFQDDQHKPQRWRDDRHAAK